MKPRVFTALMIVSLTFAIGATALADGKNDPRRLPTNTAQGNEDYIAKEVRHELTMLPFYSLFDWLEYRMEDDTVILSGQVVRPSLKSDAEHVVDNIKGVEKVVNQIEVLPL